MNALAIVVALDVSNSGSVDGPTAAEPAFKKLLKSVTAEVSNRAMLSRYLWPFAKSAKLVTPVEFAPRILMCLELGRYTYLLN